MPQSLQTLFNPANPELATLLHQFLLTETTVKPFAHSPLFPLLPQQPQCSFVCPPHQADCSLILGTVSNKPPFQWQASPHLLHYYASNPVLMCHILKHNDTIFTNGVVSNLTADTCHSHLQKAVYNPVFGTQQVLSHYILNELMGAT